MAMKLVFNTPPPKKKSRYPPVNVKLFKQITFSLNDIEKSIFIGGTWVVRTAVEIVLYYVIKVASLHTVTFASRCRDIKPL